MPCLKDITAAFTRFASSLKLEHSSLFSSVPSTLTPSIIGAISFSFVMAIATIQFLRSRARFLWVLSTASLLQCIGFIASAVHSQDGTNHLAFLASFAAITFAPPLLSIAVFTTFDCLIQTVIPEYIKQNQIPWTHFRRCFIAGVFVPCLIPLIFFATGTYYIGQFLSPAPIDGRNGAFARLLDYEIGVDRIKTAYTSQALVCTIFTVFTSFFSYASKSWAVDALNVKNKNWRELLHTISFVNGIILLRTCYKVHESQAIVASKAALADNGSLFWFCDVLPMMAALVLFCAVKPSYYLRDHDPNVFLDPEGAPEQIRASDSIGGKILR